jgi:hypothetical protein
MLILFEQITTYMYHILKEMLQAQIRSVNFMKFS